MAENENKQPAGSRRMKILQQSLVKKQAAFDQRLQNHFDDVRTRLNFYQTQYGRLTTQKDPEQPPEQQELFYGR